MDTKNLPPRFALRRQEMRGTVDTATVAMFARFFGAQGAAAAGELVERCGTCGFTYHPACATCASDHLPYLATLRRVPAEIVQSVATREIMPDEWHSCLCGWFVREQLARTVGLDADVVDVERMPTIVRGCVDAFGGEYADWQKIFGGIGYPATLPAIELAFVERVLECV